MREMRRWGRERYYRKAASEKRNDTEEWHREMERKSWSRRPEAWVLGVPGDDPFLWFFIFSPCRNRM